VAFTITEISKQNTTIDLNIVTYEDAAWITVDLDKAATGLVKFYMVWEETGEESTVYMDVVDGHVETFTNSIAPGNYTIVATYMGDSVFNTNTTSEDVEILGHVLMDTPISANVVSNGNRVTLTVKVDENATGFVELQFGDNVFNIAVKDGIGTLTTSLPYGSYSLNITYLGDENFNKNSTKLEFTIVEPAKENTPISLDIVTEENNVTMTVTVSDNATGLVKFQVSGPEEYVVYSDVINGVAVLEDVLETGDYTVIATYMGDSRFNTNITAGEFTIRGHIKKDTPITAYADVIGNRVALTVSVDENATGFVKVKLGDTIANIELTNGKGSFVQTLAEGSYFADVTYLGDDNFNINNTKLTFTIVSPVKENTTITMDIGIDENRVTYTVNVDPKATGIVKFDVAGAEDHSLYIDVVDGKAVLENVLKAGDYTVFATYMGDSIFNSNVTSEAFTIVEKQDANISIDVPSDIKVGEDVKVDVALPDNATGNVVVLVDGKEVGGMIVSGGNVTVSAGELTAGEHTIEVRYSGDKTFSPTSSSTTVNVDKVASTISAEPVEITEGETATITVTVDADATGVVLVDIAGNKFYADISAGKATVNVVGLTAGDYTAKVTYPGDDKYTEGNATVNIKVNPLPAPKVETSIAITDIAGNNITGVLKDSEGKGIAGAEVKYVMNGTAASVITAADGSFVIEALLGVPINITFAGDNTTEPATAVITVEKPVVPTPVELLPTKFDFTSVLFIRGYAVDTKAGEQGIEFITHLLDANGNPLANKTVQLAVNSKVYDQVTNSSGGVHYFLNMVRAGRYTMTYVFLGDGTYNSTLSSACVDLDKKPLTIKASAKSYKASAKTKKYTVTLSTIVGSSADGKAHLRTGMKVTMKINGKTYTSNTNSKGQATFNLKITKKGKFAAEVKYAGSNTYESVSKTVKITIK
jgi:hypothetical protein